VSAFKLWSDYQANEVAADTLYKGKRLQVEGIVTSINKDFLDEAYVTLGTPNAFMQVHANLNRDAIPEASRLEKGQAVTLDCIGGTMIIGSPSLDKCSFHPVSVTSTPAPSTPESGTRIDPPNGQPVPSPASGEVSQPEASPTSAPSQAQPTAQPQENQTAPQEQPSPQPQQN
jgi:hypothetical protein